MKRWRTRVALTSALMTVVAGWVAAVPAGAAAPQVFHQQINDAFSGDQCGFTVDSVVRGTLTIEDFVDASGNVTLEQDEAHVVSTLTNEANGKVVYVDSASRDRFDLAPVVNRDGTVTFTDTITGSPERVYTSHSNVLVKDVGLVSIVDTVDSDGNLLSEQVIVHGVHQVSGPDATYCAAIASAIG